MDESGKIKTDGAFFYVASDDAVQVVDISGPMTVVAAESVAGYVDGLYLYDNLLVVLYGLHGGGGGPWEDVEMPASERLFGIPYWIPTERRQGVAIYDISDPRNPMHRKTIEFDGHMVSSRLIKGRLHLVQQFLPELPPLAYWYDGSPAALEETVRANRNAIADMSLAQLIPHYREVNGLDDTPPESPLVAPENFYCPVSKNGGGTITTVVTFDLDDTALPFTSAGIVADAHIVYASQESLHSHPPLFLRRRGF